MSGWAGGYVSDIEYPASFYHQQSPPHMALACLLAGVDGRLPGGTDRAHYLELGCGNGLNAILMAASNPGWTVTGVDYNPAHIAQGRALARDAGVDVRLLEADLATLADGVHGLEPADVVSMHGVWSWVAPTVRAGIVRLLADVVAPGGLVHVSYNALPGWQGALGMQRLVREAGLRTRGRSSQQVGTGFQFAQALHDAGAYHLQDRMTATRLQEVGEMPPAYLAHEYMNAHWSPCFHADVAGALSDAKLDWAASSYLLELFPELTLPEAQQALLKQQDDPLLRELVKDMCLPRAFRHDVFVRGARRLGAEERDGALGDLTLMLLVPAAQFRFTLNTQAGKAELGPGYGAMVDRLSAGPARVAELAAMMPEGPNPAELCAVLVGSDQAMVVARPGAQQGPAAQRLNALLGGRVRTAADPERAGGLASVSLGTALPSSHVTRFMHARMAKGEADNADAWADRLTAGVQGVDRDKLRALLHEAAPQQRVVMRHAGVLES